MYDPAQPRRKGRCFVCCIPVTMILMALLSTPPLLLTRWIAGRNRRG